MKFKYNIKILFQYKKGIYQIKWILCQGHFKKRTMQLEADFGIEPESAFLNSIDIYSYYNNSYIYG